jgi:gas vesicle protein
MSFAVGLGIGAGLGLLLAPTSGTETRGAIRVKAVSFKDTVVDSAATVIGRASKTVA